MLGIPWPSVRILTVCTGNICRSPVADSCCRPAWARKTKCFCGGKCRNAGHGGRSDPARLCGHHQNLRRNPGARVCGTPTDTKDPSGSPMLVLAMTANAGGEVMQMDASSQKRTFTIREFARMLKVLEQRDAPHPTSEKHLFAGLPRRAASVRHLALAPDACRQRRCGSLQARTSISTQMEDQLAPASARHSAVRTPPQLSQGGAYIPGAVLIFLGHGSGSVRSRERSRTRHAQAMPPRHPVPKNRRRKRELTLGGQHSDPGCRRNVSQRRECEVTL